MKPWTKSYLKVSTFIGVLMLGVGLSGCGKQTFDVAESTSLLGAPGSFLVPPKVDIVLVEDDTGSMSEAYSQFSSQIPAFLQSMEDNRWDYRFATVPLTKFRTIDQALVSHFDINWGAAWTSPFPGAAPVAGILASLFRTPDNYSRFITTADLNNSLNGKEPGLQNVSNVLLNSSTANFTRSDAMLVVVFAGNGEDTSGVTYCTRFDGVTLPCEELGISGGTKESSYQTYKAKFAGLKPNPASLKIFAAVADFYQTGCLGGNSYPGTRYKRLAQELGGAAYDICNTPISGVLDAVNNSLEVQRLSFRTRYLFIEQDANPDTIQVVKYVNGNTGNAVTIPRSNTDGWEYKGYLNSVYAIDAHVNMNLTSGFAIELHGSAKLIGNDTAKVTYKPAGAQASN